MPTFALNFSRPGSEVIAQYYMFVSLGAEGYRAVQQSSSRVAQHIAREIAAIGPYRLLTDGSDLPVFAFTLKPEVKNYTVFDVSPRLREQCWLVPAYTFPREPTGPLSAQGRGQGRHVSRHGRPLPRRRAQTDRVARGADLAAAGPRARGGIDVQALIACGET